MANRLTMSFSRKHETNIDVEKGSLAEFSTKSGDRSIDIKVDQSQDVIRQASPEATDYTPIVPEQSIPLGKVPMGRSVQDAKEKDVEIEAKRDANVRFGTLVAMTPAKEFVFLPSDESGDSHDVLSLFNSSKDQSVAFKIQTTSPEGYKVVPHTGVLDAHQQVDIVITLLPEHRHAAHEDKFLLTTMTLSEKRVKVSLRSKSLWTMPLTTEEVRTENRFSCRVLDEEDCTSEDAGDTNIFRGMDETTPLRTSMSRNKDQTGKFEETDKSMRMLFCFILGVILLFILLVLCMVISFSFGARFPPQLIVPTPLSPTTETFHETTRSQASSALGVNQPI